MIPKIPNIISRNVGISFAAIEDILFPPLLPPSDYISASESAGDTVLDHPASQLVALQPSLDTADVSLNSMIACVLPQPSNHDPKDVNEMSAYVDDELSTAANSNPGPGPAFWQSTLDFSKKLSMPDLGIFQNRVETGTEEEGSKGSSQGNLLDRSVRA